MKGSKKIILEWVRMVLIALVISFFIRTYVAEARWVPTESMAPTIKAGDHLMTEKIAFKIKGIERGDIVVFTPPEKVNVENEDFVKRVIGLPGETIYIKDGVVYINDQPLNEPYILEKTKRDFYPFTIPDNCVFVMGDNRNNSYDSRYWGALPIENIIGRVVVLYYPLKDAKLFIND